MLVLKICALVCLLACAYAFGREDLEKYGPIRLLLNSNVIKCNLDRTLNLDVGNINVFFYDFPNSYITSFPIHQAAKGILRYKHLDKTKKFIMYVGGYKSQIHKRTEEQMRQAYAVYPNSYLIIPDHSPYTNNQIGKKKSYERAVRYVYYIGQALGKLWVQLKEGGIRPKNVHCVGHSLGGQMLGHVGETFFNATGEKIGRISALDPAGPCFTKSDIQDQVRSGVAEYVEVYHCNSGALGSSSILGDVDYFINKKGEAQPSCGTPFIPGLWDSSKAASCSHRACIDVWTASVKNPELFTAYRCDSYNNFKKMQCPPGKTIAGAWSPGTAKGVYYFSTMDYDLNEIK